MRRLPCLLAAIGAGFSLKAGETLPPIPVNAPHAEEKGRSWERAFENPAEAWPFHGKASEVSVRVTDVLVEVEFEYIEPEARIEMVFADDEGRFESCLGSGCFRAASLILPASDEKGKLLDTWPVDWYDIGGYSLGTLPLAGLYLDIPGAWFSLSGSSTFLRADPTTYPTPQVAAALEWTGADKQWTVDRFQCFNGGNRFESQSSHGLREGKYAWGSAELFLWHPAPIRLSWDIHSRAKYDSVSLPTQVGQTKQQGSAFVTMVHRCSGKLMEAGKKSFRPETREGVDTLLFASNLPTPNLRFVEARQEEAEWQRLDAVLSEGIWRVEIPSEWKDVDLRLLWVPATVRVVVDIPRIGGSLPANGNAKTFNEIEFPLHGTRLDNGSIQYFLWQLLGSSFEIETVNYDPEATEGIETLPWQLWSADRLFLTWRELNPHLDISFEPSPPSFMIRDRK